jgi:hypothetical protein
MTNIYWERQRGGQCRLHSINAYFGLQKYSDDMFYSSADEFDTIQNDKFGTTTSCKSFDLINSDQRNLVSYILGKHNIYVRYVAINLHRAHIEDAIKSGCFFVFNLDHIWIVKKHNDAWHKVDSMSGVGYINPSRLGNEKNIGIMIPISNLNAEFARLSKQIDVDTNGDALQFIRSNHISKKILGDVEVYLGSVITILQIQLAGRIGFPHIDRLILRYMEFVRELYNSSRYNDLAFLESEVPPILTVVKLLSSSCC